MGFSVPSPLNDLSLQQALELGEVYLEYAYRTTDSKIVAVLCHEAKVALSQAENASTKHPAHPNGAGYQVLLQRMGGAYMKLSELHKREGHGDKARAFCVKAEKWRQVRSYLLR
jgi:hypothetical protein